MKNTSTPVRFSMLIPSSLLIGATIISGLYLYTKSNARQYSSPIKTESVEGEKDCGASGMAQYFFNARKNSVTGQMDYLSMMNTENIIATMRANKASHRTASLGLGLSWNELGPSNVGGRTRGILVYNQDPTGNTLFAAAVSGGIWKSTDGGATWNKINDRLSSLEACDLAQDANGVIYCGTGEGFSVFGYPTGEGFSSGMIGGGIFKSTDGGKSFTLIPSTKPAPNNDGIPWAYTNRIAISSCNPQVIYAATNTGLMISKNGGTSWSQAYNSINKRSIGGIALDVKISNDGKAVLACINGTGYVAYPNCGDFDTLFTQLPSLGAGKLPTGGAFGRIEFAISPTNSQYMYASVVTNTGVVGKSLIGVYFSMNQGQYWHLIGPGGSPTFDPYSAGVQDQGTYDNTLAVFPSNPGQVLVGGTTLYEWQQTSPTDSMGYWSSLTIYGGFPGYPYYIHPDEHAIVFDLNHPNVAYVGCDGGIYKSTNITAAAPYTPTWEPMNRNYNVTQFYSISFSPYTLIGATGPGVLGGTQDNGTPYMNYTSPLYNLDQVADMSGGDGGGSAISFVNPNVFFTCTDYGGSLNRGSSLSSVGFPSSFYTKTEGIGKGANIDSVSRGTGLGSSGGCFVFPMALYENLFDNNTVDSMLWVSDKSYKAGDTIHPISPNGNVAFSYILPKAEAKGDSLMVKNIVVSKIAVAFNENNGVWLCMQAADLSDPIIWMPIGGPKSLPTHFTGNYPVHCMAWSPDGDALFVGTEDGQLFRFSNLDSLRDSSYYDGALFSVQKGNGAVINNPKCKVISTNIDQANTFNGRDILSISVDPRNGNNMLVTLGNYGQNFYVYYSSNALSANPTFAVVQGTGPTALPPMPVYSSVLALYNSGHPNSAVVATEHGVYSTQNITAPNPAWDTDYAGAPNTLVLSIKQQTLPASLCNNSGDLYMGTHGRGAYYTGSLGPALGTPTVSAPDATEYLKVYPNPMSTQGTVDFTLAKEESITITIYDLQGRTVKTMNLGKQMEGQHLVPIQTGDFANGTYLVSVSGNTFRKTARIIVVK